MQLCLEDPVSFEDSQLFGCLALIEDHAQPEFKDQPGNEEQ